MAVKAVMDIDLNDERFKEFQARFEKWQSALQKLPGTWGLVDKGMKSSFETVAAALLAQAELTKKIAKNQKELDNSSDRGAKSWRDVAKSTKSVLGNVKEITLSLLKWSSIGSIFGGLAGFGSLFGLAHLAADVSGSRRSALGLGSTPGEIRSFRLNFRRLIEPDTFLGGVNEALHDVTKRKAFFAAGLTEADLRSGDSALIGAKLLQKLKPLIDRQDPRMLGKWLQIFGFDQFGLDTQQALRIRNTPAREQGILQSRFTKDIPAFNFAADQKWQDFYDALDRAKASIEGSFVNALSPLVQKGTFEKLSQSVSLAITNLLKNKEVKHFIEHDIGPALEGFGKMLASQKFQDDMKTFGRDVVAVAEGLAKALRWLGLIPKGDPVPSDEMKKKGFTRYDSRIKGFVKPGEKPSGLLHTRQFWDPNQQAPAWWMFASPDDVRSGPQPFNNPGNLRPRSGKGFLHFSTMDQGLQAMGQQLLRYEDKYRLDTIAKIVNRYAPPGDHNDTAAYIRDVAKRTGFGATEHLNLHDRNVLAKLISAMTKHENRRTNFQPKTVVEILNRAGSDLVVASAQASR